MLLYVFGNSSPSSDNDNKNDTSIFVQKPFLRTSSIEAYIVEDIDSKKQYRAKNSPDPISIREKQIQQSMLIICSTILAY